MIYIYKHRNKLNGKVYIGQTVDIKNRWTVNNYKKCSRFYNAIQKYGWDNFTHEILSEIEDQNEADNQEIALIAYFDSTNPEKGYNILPGGGINNRGMKFTFSEEHRKNISLSRSKIIYSDETKKKISDAKKGSKNGRAKGVYLVNIIEGWDEYYPCIKDICTKYPEWNYKSIKSAAERDNLFKNKYKIEYEKE